MNVFFSQALLLGLTGLMGVIFAITFNLPNQEMFISIMAVILIVLSLLLERIKPFETHWNNSQKDTAADITSMVVIFGILDPLLKWATPFMLVFLLVLFTDGAHYGISLPIWAEIILVTLLIELGAYISHRLHHHVNWLWSLHAMHHSTKRLYTLNNFRFHPFNHILNYIMAIAPAVLLGFSPEAILAYTALSLPVLLLQHSNVNFRFGWLSYIFNTNEVHRWHHSTLLSEGNRNFGRALVVWDLVFGTYYLPSDKRQPVKIGLFGDGGLFPPPSKYLAQIAYPFSSDCCKK